MANKSLTDISYVTYNTTQKKLDVLNLNYKNINHVNKITFEAESSRFINFNFGKRVTLKNVQILSGAQVAVESTVWYKRRGVPQYSRYFENTTSKFDLIDQDDIIFELNFTQPTPSLFFYDPDYTDNIFTVDEDNNTHIIWYYETQSPQKLPNDFIKRYSNNIPIGTYSIYEFNKQLFNVFLDGRIFKEEYPIEIVGKYPKLKLNLHPRSEYRIIIDKDSPLFTYLGITQADMVIIPNVSYSIPFTYDPYSNTEFVMRYNNSGKYDSYRTGTTISPFISHIPITDESNNEIRYTTSDKEIRINLLANAMMEFEGNVLLEESITDQQSSGLFTYFNDISCNTITSNYFTSNSIYTNDASLGLIDISGTLYSYNLDSSNITINTSDISNNITASNLSSNLVSTNLINTEFIDVSNGFIKLNNSKNFNISYNKYKFIRFDLSINNLNTDKTTTFNNFKFYDISNSNPLFRLWTYNSNNYTLYNTIYDNSINYTGDASSIIFDFKNPVPQGISFSYNKNDIGKIFKIDSSNNNIHYKPSNDNNLGINNVIQAQLPDNSYDLVGINSLLTQQHGGTIIDPNVRTTSAGGVRVKIGDNQFEDLVTDISYTIVDKNTNELVGIDDASVNIIRDFLRFENTNPLRPYEEFVYFSSNETKLLFFIDNSFIDISYSLLYDSSYSFFKHFFEPDISFLTPNDLKSGATVFWNENTGAETSNDAPLTLLNSNTDWNLNLRDPSNNIDISGNASVSDNSGNIFAALLTLRDEFVQNPEIIPYYKNDTYTDISSGEWTVINFNKQYKNRFFLSDYSNNYLDYSSNNIYISIPYTADIINIDNSSNVLLKHKMDSQGPTYDSSFVNLNKNFIMIEKNIVAKDISCLDISLSNIFGNKEYLINNLDVSNNCTVKNIETYINGDPSYVGFSTSRKITKMANYISSGDISNSGFRMEIGPEISGNNAGWYIKMIGDNNSNNSGDAAIIFRPKDILGLDNTWFDMSCDLVLSNSAFNIVSDDRYKHNEIDISNATLTVKKIVPKSYIKTRDLYDSNYNIDITNAPPGTTYESGYIAQDILTIPELVHVVQNGYKLSINYNGIQPYLCKAIQELYAEVVSLELQIQALENI
jgi:hypothetical protein